MGVSLIRVSLTALFVFSDIKEIESNETDSYQIFDEIYYKDAPTKEKAAASATNKLICYYVFSQNFSPSIIDGLCTHINVGFFLINKKNNSLEISKKQEEDLNQIILLKNKTKDLKIIISVGGSGDTGFSSVVMNHSTRKMFIRSCMDIIKTFKIDGIDLDWEYPVVDTGNKKEKVKFIQLLQEFKTEFNRHKKKYILSADVSSLQNVMELGYYVNYIADFVDYVNVMCYDYHFFTKLYPFTGHNSPLYSTGDNFFPKNINQSIYAWISSSMPREKLIVGIPTYGHTFELLSSKKHSLVAPAKGFGSVGKNGFADYQQICDFLKLDNTTVVYDDVSKVPYAYNFPEWISYDDERSLTVKATYILSENLGGAMVFSVNADDFNGNCKGDGVTLPLIRKIRNTLFNEP